MRSQPRNKLRLTSAVKMPSLPITIFDNFGKINYPIAEEIFKKEVHDRAAEVDPTNEYDWLCLTIGWALGKGAEPEDAALFAVHIRYQTDLG